MATVKLQWVNNLVNAKNVAVEKSVDGGANWVLASTLIGTATSTNVIISDDTDFRVRGTASGGQVTPYSNVVSVALPLSGTVDSLTATII